MQIVLAENVASAAIDLPVSDEITTIDIRRLDPHSRVILDFKSVDFSLPLVIQQECQINSENHQDNCLEY